ncbi:MAG: hypothetical protein K9L85_01565 [Candidatus Peribacteraceae bacterium]|nr:hypothetical protein [Candidatus Peribacteraceae bacterium]
MHSKQFKFAAITLALTFLAACGQKTDLAITGIENSEAVAAANEIETVEGTPAEKVETYSEKAVEAQAKLQLLLEEAENEQSSLLDVFVPTAFAAELTLEDQIAALLAEIETYTELAAEAATEETDPQKLIGLLGRVQEVQSSTAEIVENPPARFQRTIFAKVKLKVATRTAEIDEAAAEAEDARDSGAAEVEVEVETDVEDLLAGGERRIRINERENLPALAELKIQNAIKELEKIRVRVDNGEILEEDATEILAGLEEQIEAAKSLADGGDFEAAIEAASAGKRAINKIKSVVARAKDAKARAEELKELAAEGDAVAAEKLEKLQPFLEEGKELKKILAERQEVHKEFLEEAQAERGELSKIRRGINSDLLDLKKAEAAGEISTDEFEEQKEALLEQARELGQQRIEAEQKLREEHLELLGELNGLSDEEAKVKREDLRKEIQNRERVIRADQRKLYDAIETGNQESIEAVKAGIQAKQEKVREEQKAQVQRFVEQKIESLSDDEQEVLKQKREELREIRGEASVDLNEIQKGVQEIKRQVQLGQRELDEAEDDDEDKGDSAELEPQREVKRDVRFAPPLISTPPQSPKDSDEEDEDDS